MLNGTLCISRWAVSKVAWLAILVSTGPAPVIFASQASVPISEAGSKAPDLNLIVRSLVQARQRDTDGLRSRKITREYKIFRHDAKEPVSQVTAEIRFVSQGKSTYEIIHASGSSRGQKVVRKILDRETQPTKKDHYSEIDDRNYEFAFLRQENLDGHPMYVLRLIPKKREKGLLRGLIWVDTNTFHIWRIEGVPAIKPSFWIKTVDIRLQFAEVSGMWLHTSLEVTAIVRIFGKYVLIGRDVGLQITTTSPHDRDTRVNGEINVPPEGPSAQSFNNDLVLRSQCGTATFILVLDIPAGCLRKAEWLFGAPLGRTGKQELHSYPKPTLSNITGHVRVLHELGKSFARDDAFVF